MSLRISAVFFAVLWTAGMLWFDAPIELHKLIIWSIAGAIAGLLWYWVFAKWMKRVGMLRAIANR